MIGISIANDAFELICGDPIGGRRYLDEATVTRVEEFGSRYADLLGHADLSAELLALGRDLYRFLDGEACDLTALIDRAARPLHFEIAAITKQPSPGELALMRAPWELLANNNGFLASDAILGFSQIRRLGRPEKPPVLDQYRLGLVFMAASPRGAIELDYEAEETAIMQAVGTTQLDLMVEESGNPEELSHRIVEVPAMQALHLSCHGDNAWRSSGQHDADSKPVLMLEDEVGDELPTEAGRLINVLTAQTPRLVFLSACLSAAAGARRDAWRGDKQAAQGPRHGGAVAQSLSEALIAGGVPAVLGWDGSVRDVAATKFAATLYDSLAGRNTLADAVAAARRGLLNAPEEAARRDWHLARLWLGPRGGGTIVGGRTRRTMMPAVATHPTFVGRRRELQAGLRALRDGQHVGVLVHGTGQIGKSCMGARIARRRPDLRLASVSQQYGALDILAALKMALRQHEAASNAVREAERRVRQDTTQLEQELTLLFSGPCAQTGDGGAPVLLMIDGFERTMAWDADQHRYVVSPNAASVLHGVLRAFDPATTESRLIITSRFPLRLEGAEGLLYLSLPPLSPAAQQKLNLRQQGALLSSQCANPAGLIAERSPLLARVPGIARGNPGLQDLLGREFVLSCNVTTEHATQVLKEVEAWLAHGELPTDTKARAFLENLDIDRLIALAGDAGRELLRGLTLFTLPIPETSAEKIAGMVKGSLPHLRDLGLIEVHEDLVDYRKSAVAASGLAAARVAPLSDTERKAVAREVARDLFTRWSGTAPNPARPPACDLELTRLGLLAEDGDIVATCGGSAVRELQRGPANDAVEVGRVAIQLLDEQKRKVPWRLLCASAEAEATCGDGEMADTLIERGLKELAQLRVAAGSVDATEMVLLLDVHADRLVTRGDYDEALRIREDEQLPVFDRLCDLHSHAVIMGKIADILDAKGELDEALRIRREEELPVYERLGQAYSRAVTLGQVADILHRRGDLDDALRLLRDELLPEFERLGDPRARAITQGQIADILVDRGDLDEALRIRKDEQLPVFKRLNDVRERVLALGRIADILVIRGDLDEALRIRKEEQLPVFDGLVDVHSRAVTMGRIADILVIRGDLDEALRIRRDEELPVYAQLGEKHELAATMGQVADILTIRGDLDEALRIRREEQLPVFERLGDVCWRAITLGRIADILVIRGDFDEALRISREQQLPVFERLGDVRWRAITLGRIADILVIHGDLDEALRISREQQLPVFERLGDVRWRAITLGRIADIFVIRGDLEDALRISREQQLPVFERLGDVRWRAITLGRIAEILVIRGDLDKALRIRREEQLPVFERLGDVRCRAIALGRIADILVIRGDHDEALRIRREQQLPVFERLGDVRRRAMTLGQIADTLVSRGEIDEARALKDECLTVNRRLNDAEGIASTLWGLARIDIARGKTAAALPRIVESYDILLHLGRADLIAEVGLAYGQLVATGDKPADALVMLRRSAEMFRKLGRDDDARQTDLLAIQLKVS